MHVESLVFLPKIQKEKNEIKENIDTAQEIIKELNDLSEHIIINLDAKIQRLYKMMEDVDQKIKNQAMLIDKNNTGDIKDIFENSVIGLEEKKQNLQDIGPVAENNPSVEEVLQLFTQGYSSSQIAKHLNKGIGEVQLIHNLKKR